MRTAAGDLLAELWRRGIQVEAHGDRLRYRPRSAVTPELAQRLKSRKAELLESIDSIAECIGMRVVLEKGPKTKKGR